MCRTILNLSCEVPCPQLLNRTHALAGVAIFVHFSFFAIGCGLVLGLV